MHENVYVKNAWTKPKFEQLIHILKYVGFKTFFWGSLLLIAFREGETSF